MGKLEKPTTFHVSEQFLAAVLEASKYFCELQRCCTHYWNETTIEVIILIVCGDVLIHKNHSTDTSDEQLLHVLELLCQS